MKRITLGFSTAACLLLSGMAILGCNGSGGDPDGGNGLPDGFISNSCTMVSDCAPTSCQTAKCNPVTKMCEYKTKVCTAESECTKGVCDENADGACVQQPANDGMACSTMDGDPGSCVSGTCTAVPTCAPASAFLSDAECDADDASVTQDTNAPMSFGGGSPVIGAYPCAPSEAGPEIAYVLNHDQDAGDEDITISIRPVNADGTPGTDDKDLDLIILEDQCTGSATCMNPAVTGGFQGVTAGTANERVTFKAAAGKTYYVVVDGKDMNQVKDFVMEVEACGKCQPTASTRLSCNMTMPINGSTASGAAQITDYKCGEPDVAVAAAGKELPFLFRTDDDAVRNVTASLTGASADYKLLVLPTSFWGQCDPDACLTHKDGPAASNTITWKVDPGFNGFARYWVVVDSPTAGTDTNFGLQLSCAPYCVSPYNLSCVSNEVKLVSNATTTDGPKQASKWGPGAGCDSLTGLVGPEKAVRFKSAAITNADYELRLASKTAGKNLSITLLDAGTTMDPACDPTATCKTNTVLTTGFTGTRTTNSNTTPAGIKFTAEPGHTYFAIIDSVDATGGAFDLQVVGVGGGAGCQ
jgi:hypothetical protein